MLDGHAAQVPTGTPPPGARYYGPVTQALRERGRAAEAAFAEMALRGGIIADAAARLVAALRSGRKVLVAGNGGSATEAQHLAAELVGRFKRERAPYAALALTTDTAILTALANDYGYQHVFARQVRGLGNRGDVFIAISTSGESENLVRAAQAASECGITPIALTGDRESRLERVCDLTIRVPTHDTAAAQELHMAVTHILCDIVEAELASLARGIDA